MNWYKIAIKYNQMTYEQALKIFGLNSTSTMEEIKNKRKKKKRLKKQKKNLQSSNSKDQTMLDYQATEKSETKNPMPKCPKRAKIENRIGQRNQKIEEIDSLLLNYVGKE